MNNLNKLIEDFLKNFTFNNIDILLSHRQILALDAQSLEDKLIAGKRGGYCFENNQYFYNFLQAQGFKIERYLGRVVFGGSSNVTRTHQVSVVSLTGRTFLVDVGFGPYTPGIAVPMDGSMVRAFNGNEYRLKKINDEDFQLEVLKDGVFLSLYQFNLATYVEADFKLANYYTNTHHDSKFTTSLILSQLKERGVTYLTNLNFTTIVDGVRKDQLLESEEQFVRTINSNFNVSFTEEELKSLFHLVLAL